MGEAGVEAYEDVADVNAGCGFELAATAFVFFAFALGGLGGFGVFLFGHGWLLGRSWADAFLRAGGHVGIGSGWVRGLRRQL